MPHTRTDPHASVSHHQHGHEQGGHRHSHGLVDASIKRSREGMRAVALALLVLGLTAAAQVVVYALSGSVALLADLIHNAGDAAYRAAAGHRVRATQRPPLSGGPAWPPSWRSSSARASPATRR